MRLTTPDPNTRDESWRPALCCLLSVLSSFLLVAAVHAAPQAREARGRTWVVSGTWKNTRAAAVADALQRARQTLDEYFQEEKTPLRLVPSRAYIRQHFLKDLRLEEAVFHDPDDTIGKQAVIDIDGHTAVEKKHTFAKNLGETRRVCLKISLTPQAVAEIESQDRHYRAREEIREREATVQERMLLLARVLAGLVAALAVVAGYIRLDDWTKGYYTGWLRLAAVAIVAAVGVGMWFISP